MRILLMAVILTLSGCAAMYDSQDLCQNYYNKPNYEYPRHCGGTSARYVTRDYYTNRPLTTTRIEK